MGIFKKTYKVLTNEAEKEFKRNQKMSSRDKKAISKRLAHKRIKQTIKHFGTFSPCKPFRY